MKKLHMCEIWPKYLHRNTDCSPAEFLRKSWHSGSTKNTRVRQLHPECVWQHHEYRFGCRHKMLQRNTLCFNKNGTLFLLTITSQMFTDFNDIWWECTWLYLQQSHMQHVKLMLIEHATSSFKIVTVELWPPSDQLPFVSWLVVRSAVFVNSSWPLVTYRPIVGSCPCMTSADVSQFVSLFRAVV